MTTSRLRVDEDLCAGHGRCFTLHADLVGSDDAGYPVVLVGALDGTQERAAEDAVSECPEGALSIEDVD